MAPARKKPAARAPKAKAKAAPKAKRGTANEAPSEVTESGEAPRKLAPGPGRPGAFLHHVRPDGIAVWSDSTGARGEEIVGAEGSAEAAYEAGADPYGLTEPGGSPPSLEALLDAARRAEGTANRPEGLTQA
jgi:hypothetical protein